MLTYPSGDKSRFLPSLSGVLLHRGWDAGLRIAVAVGNTFYYLYLPCLCCDSSCSCIPPSSPHYLSQHQHHDSNMINALNFHSPSRLQRFYIHPLPPRPSPPHGPCVRSHASPSLSRVMHRPCSEGAASHSPSQPASPSQARLQASTGPSRPPCVVHPSRTTAPARTSAQSCQLSLHTA